MQNNPVLRVAFVGVVAILAMLFMISLMHRMPSRAYSTGQAYLAETSNNFLSSEYPTLSSEQQQAQLSEIIAEQDSQQKLVMAKEMSRFTMFHEGTPTEIVNPDAFE
ncbi:MAG TPA: hypothetical protein VJG90_00675 [Candidatus Nanoarchaeia archaeon]|nr:hypothetical protein [Candidatus Nanoarchaeia archaeon]